MNLTVGLQLFSWGGVLEIFFNRIGNGGFAVEKKGAQQRWHHKAPLRANLLKNGEFENSAEFLQHFSQSEMGNKVDY